MSRLLLLFIALLLLGCEGGTPPGQNLKVDGSTAASFNASLAQIRATLTGRDREWFDQGVKVLSAPTPEDQQGVVDYVDAETLRQLHGKTAAELIRYGQEHETLVELNKDPGPARQ